MPFSRHLALAAAFWLAGTAAQAPGQEPLRPPVLAAPAPTPHWIMLRDRYTGFVFDADAGRMIGSMPLSLFSPALQADVDSGVVYSYGSFYSRTFYGERTDVVLFYDLATMAPMAEVEVPAKTAGIGHDGWLGLLDQRFLAVFNITPATSLSIVDVRSREFVTEISTPGCAGAYPIAEGFLMPCGDGTLQYVALDDSGNEASRTRSRRFFAIDGDPVFDYAVPAGDAGYVFVSFEGLVYSASVENGEVRVSEPWSIVTDEDREAQWRIGGYQPFAYNAARGLLVTIMHQGGKDTFEDPGTEVWAFDVNTRRRGYRVAFATAADDEVKVSAVQLTQDDDPLLLVRPDGHEGLLHVYGAMTGRHQRTIEQAGTSGGGMLSNVFR